MQLALNAVLFALGFYSAVVAITKPRESRASLERAVKNVDYILSTVRALLTRKDVPVREIEEDRSLIYTKEQIEEEYKSDSWQRNAYEDLKATLLSKEAPFPCVYATKGYRDNEHRYVFLESQNPNGARNIRRISKALHEYLTDAPCLGPNTSLVIIAASPSQDDSLAVEDYRQQFWHMLRGLHIADPKQWPADMPTDTGSARWTFCFDGVPLFPVALTPAHQMRASRRASNFTVAIQPKWVLDDLLATPERRQVATNKVRTLLTKYDQVDISPDLTEYGQPGTSEARQLFLLDQNETSECPFEDFDD